MHEDAWFAGVDSDDPAALTDAVREASAEQPREWPRIAVESGVADDEADYYDRLHDATVRAAETAAREAGRADDRQLIHLVRAMDDGERVANELAERVAEWGESRDPDAGTGVDYARELIARSSAEAASTDSGETDSADSGEAGSVDSGEAGSSGEQPGDDGDGSDESGPGSAGADARLVGLAERVVDLADERDALRAAVERRAPEVAPNLAAMAGPVLAARLIALAGGLKSLARSPSGTVQVLGAEDALFAHLRGNAPSPKHGVIYTHEYVRGTRPEDRGSAARALAGKLAIAARIDHYSGDRRPELQAELDERMATIRARAADESDREGKGDD